MPSSLSTWIARADFPALDIRCGDAITVQQSADSVEVSVHRVIPADATAVNDLARAGVLERATLGPSCQQPVAPTPLRILPFGALPDRRRSTAQTG